MSKKFTPNNELFIYTLFDTKLMSHVSAILAPNDDYAKRLFASSLSETQIFSPSDFLIYRAGSFDSTTANIEPSVESLCSLSDLFVKRDGNAEANSSRQIDDPETGSASN